MCLGLGYPLTRQNSCISLPSAMYCLVGPVTRLGGMPLTVRVPLAGDEPWEVEATQV